MYEDDGVPFDSYKEAVPMSGQVVGIILPFHEAWNAGDGAPNYLAVISQHMLCLGSTDLNEARAT